MAVIQEFVSALFPRSCMGCQKLGHYLCDDCRSQAKLAPLSTQASSTRAIFAFDGLIKNLIHAFKYEAQFWVLDFLDEFIKKSREDFLQIDCVIPVPLHPKRLRERGYNQSALLAKTWAQNLRQHSHPEALTRMIDTPSQTGLSREARKENVKNAFLAKNPKQILGRSILLVDDVRTTGATLSEAARVLKEAGAKEVQKWSIAAVL